MGIFVQSRADGYWRGGQQHLSQGKEFLEGTFSDEQLKALHQDPDIMMVADTVEDLPGGVQADPVESPETVVEESGVHPALVLAACAAKEAGLITRTGAPKVGAMEEILGEDISSSDRDAAWAAWQAQGGK